MADARYKRKYFWIKEGKLGIGYWGSDGLTAVDEVKTVQVFYDKKVSARSDLPPQFHEAVTFFAIQRGYEIRGNPEYLQVAQYWRAGFEKALKRIQEFKNKRFTQTPPIIKTNYPYAVK